MLVYMVYGYSLYVYFVIMNNILWDTQKFN